MSPDQQMIDYLADVVGVVEANSFEQLALWEREQWPSEGRSGPLVKVGELAGMPVCIALMKITVRGHNVAFMDVTSQVVDYRLIDAWLAAHLPKGARRVDAMNFHNVFPLKAESASGEELL